MIFPLFWTKDNRQNSQIICLWLLHCMMLKRPLLRQISLLQSCDGPIRWLDVLLKEADTTVNMWCAPSMRTSGWLDLLLTKRKAPV